MDDDSKKMLRDVLNKLKKIFFIVNVLFMVLPPNLREKEKGWGVDF